MVPLGPLGSADGDAPASSTSPAPRLLYRLRRAEEKVALKHSPARNCCGKPRSVGLHGCLRQQVEISTACPRLLPSWRLWEDGAAVEARGSCLAGSWLHPRSWGARQGEHPAWLGQDRQHPPRRSEGAESDASGTGLASRELQVQAPLPHPSPAPKGFEESPGIQHRPQTPGFCTTHLFPT